ncbi:hypothetical protein ACFOWX_03925 [Sphingorhabdus arenilitoris]|uniref:HEAT repeat domain-containing protein n=1 Tax=Sphingorhabdus arenilitoris TaxID=1490041 RepID=A0ABV8RDT2_9SPHN
MFLMFGMVLGPLAVALAYFYGLNRRYNADKAQHHLASMMIAEVTQNGEATREDIVQHLRHYAPSDRLRRVNHALKLIKKTVSAENYGKALELAKSVYR